MPAFETRVAPDDTISYRARVRLQGRTSSFRQLCPED